MQKRDNDKDAIGHNSFNIDEFKNLASVVDDAVNYISKLLIKNDSLERSLRNAVHGKNVVVRANALKDAGKINNQISIDIEPFKKSLNAITTDEDIHSGTLKTAKLEMCAEGGNFGNHIANSTIKKEKSLATQIINKKSEAEEDLKEVF
mgnify:FL=1